MSDFHSNIRCFDFRTSVYVLLSYYLELTAVTVPSFYFSIPGKCLLDYRKVPLESECSNIRVFLQNSIIFRYNKLCILNVHILDYKPWITANFINLGDKYEYPIDNSRQYQENVLYPILIRFTCKRSWFIDSRCSPHTVHKFQYAYTLWSNFLKNRFMGLYGTRFK